MSCVKTGMNIHNYIDDTQRDDMFLNWVILFFQFSEGQYPLYYLNKRLYQHKEWTCSFID